MILVIGEILFDLFENEKQLGGAPFNFAYHLKNFGFPVRYISKIGNDRHGKEILTLLKQYYFNIDDIQTDGHHDTGTVEVQLSSSGIPTFHIKPDVAYDYIDHLPEKHLSLVDTADFIYFGTLIQRSSQGFENIQKFMDRRRSDAVCFYDINLRPGCYSDKVIMTSLEHADFLKLNEKELEECQRIFRFSKDENAFIPFLMDKYALNIVAITKGDNGSKLYTKDGCFHSKINRVPLIVDTVGAGDAYSAMLATGIIKGWKPERTLSMASMFASRICEIRGAIPESQEFYEPIKKMIENGE
ncbi:MAG: carbohydrate kinase [Deltaproteobacteria bacterium]|nr:carbohydrate kinase [Deltaproteobacteria bacterium]